MAQVKIQDEVREVSFEFVMFKLLTWEFSNDPSSKESNLAKLNGRKLLLAPFFVAIANGSFRELFDLFSPFYALEEGPIPQVAIEYFIKRFQFKHLSKSIEKNLTFEDVQTKIKNNDNIDNFINSTIINQKEFKEYKFQSGKLIKQTIEESIEKLKIKIPDFLRMDDRILMSMARQHRSWLVRFNQNRKLRDSDINNLIIPIEDAVNDRKIINFEIDTSTLKNSFATV